MKILFLNHNLRGEGTYFRAFNFARYLARQGHDLTLLTVSPNLRFSTRRAMAEGVLVIETPRFMDQHRGGWAPLDILYKIFHCLTHDYDIIHGFDHKPNVSFPIFMARLFRKRAVLVSDWADWWTKGGISAASRWTPEIVVETFLEEFVRKVAAYNTVTSLVLRDRARSLGLAPSKISYIPSGCDTEHIKPLAPGKTGALRARLGLPVKGILFEFIGFGQADVDYLVDAFDLAREKNRRLTFLIVGPPDKRVAARVAASPNAKSIICTGRVPYAMIPSYAAAADICLLPLRDNPANRGRGPIKAGDYLAAGKPIIANPVGDIKVFVEKFKVGVCAGFRPEDMAAQMLKLAASPLLRARLAKNAALTARNKLSWALVSRMLENFYGRAMAARAGAKKASGKYTFEEVLDI